MLSTGGVPVSGWVMRRREIPTLKQWVSIDPAKGSSGVAFWEGNKLVEVAVVKPRGKKGPFYVGDLIVEDRYKAWEAVLEGKQDMIIERGAGGLANVVRAQGWITGYIESIFEREGGEPIEVVVSEWRRCIKEAYDVSWPANRERMKALSVQLVHAKFGLTVGDDIADAVLLGVAAMRMGLVQVI